MGVFLSGGSFSVYMLGDPGQSRQPVGRGLFQGRKRTPIVAQACFVAGVLAARCVAGQRDLQQHQSLPDRFCSQRAGECCGKRRQLSPRWGGPRAGHDRGPDVAWAQTHRRRSAIGQLSQM